MDFENPFADLPHEEPIYGEPVDLDPLSFAEINEESLDEESIKAVYEEDEFKISVTDPTKEDDNLKSYTSYKVHTEYQRTVHVVSRRYSDFEFLYNQLLIGNIGIIVPGIPLKKAFGNFNPQFIETRRRGLERFIQKVAGNRVLRMDPFFKSFLMSLSFKTDTFQREKPILSKALVPQDPLTPLITLMFKREHEMRQLALALDSLEPKFLDLSKMHLKFSDRLIMMAEVEPKHETAFEYEKLSKAHLTESTLTMDIFRLAFEELYTTIEEYLHLYDSAKQVFQIRQGLFSLLEQKVENLKRYEHVTQTLRLELERIEYEQSVDLSLSLKSFCSVFHRQEEKIFNLWK